MPQVYARATTTVVGGLTAGATSLTVAGIVGFPAGGRFAIRIDTETLLVTAGAGTTTWTVVRGTRRTTDATHAAGAVVRWLPPLPPRLDRRV